VGLDGADWGCGCWDGKSYDVIRIFIEAKLGNGDGYIQEIESSWSLWPRGSVIYGVARSEITTITIYHREQKERSNVPTHGFFNSSKRRSILRNLWSKESHSRPVSTPNLAK
jgi:hypothetical protein